MRRASYSGLTAQKASPFVWAAMDSIRQSAGAWVLLLAMTLLLAACGKIGPPQPIGPADKVIWPHGYPTPHPAS